MVFVICTGDRRCMLLFSNVVAGTISAGGRLKGGWIRMSDSAHCSLSQVTYNMREKPCACASIASSQPSAPPVRPSLPLPSPPLRHVGYCIFDPFAVGTPIFLHALPTTALEEHGPGAMHVMRVIKRGLDPRGLMNPGKVLAHRRDPRTGRLVLCA